MWKGEKHSLAFSYHVVESYPCLSPFWIYKVLLLKEIKTHTWQEALFTQEANPAIGFFKNVCLWIIIHAPDLSLVEGWKHAVIRIFWVMLALSMISWLISEGITPFNVLIKAIIFMVIASIVNIHSLASAVYGAISIWEMKGFDLFTNKETFK